MKNTITQSMRTRITKQSEMAKYPATFNAILKKVLSKIDVSGMTSKQIAQIVDFAYTQRIYGENKMFKELNS